MTETQQTINNVIAKMIAYSDGNKHDIAHFLKVYTYARMWRAPVKKSLRLP